MKTLKLYDSDPYLLKTGCRVLSCEQTQQGWAAVTDQTVFFARGGGQPCDKGRLGGAEVLDTYEEGGELLHLLSHQVPTGEAEMEIDPQTRFDHMQQHLGQHILSAAFAELFQDASVIARIESPVCHVELERALSDEELLRAQDRANEIIKADLPVRCYFVTPEESRKLPVRGHISPHESVRLVEIEGYDLNGCGGTHCRSTGGVGQILLCGTKEVRGNFRVYYVCGDRALREAHDRTAPLLSLQRAFGTESLFELCEKAPAVLTRKNELEEQNRLLREQMVESDAALFAALAEPAGSWRMFSRVIENGDAKHLKAACDRVVTEGGILLLLAAAGEEQTSFIFARGKGEGPDLGKALRELTSAHGGKGGGSPVMAQGMISGSGWREAFDALTDRLKAELCAQ